MEFSGEFETHITVRLDGESGLPALREWGELRGLKCLHIVLARGQSVSQPMLTRRGRGDFSAQLAVATQLSRELAEDGFNVTRVKIEAAPNNQDIPQSDADAIHHRDRYFEQHVKLLLDVRTDFAALTDLAQRHAAHLSRNAMRVRSDGRQERFITQRCWSSGSATAHGMLGKLLAELKQSGYDVIDVEEEYVVYDSNVTVDSGWLPEMNNDKE